MTDHVNNDVSENLSSSKLPDHFMRSSISLREYLGARCPRGDAIRVHIAIFLNIFLRPALSVRGFFTIVVEAACRIIEG